MEEARKLRSEFLQVLRSRRSGEVPMLVEPAKPVANLLFQEANPPSFSELIAQPGIRHRMTPLMVTEASDWFDQFLKQ